MAELRSRGIEWRVIRQLLTLEIALPERICSPLTNLSRTTTEVGSVSAKTDTCISGAEMGAEAMTCMVPSVMARISTPSWARFFGLMSMLPKGTRFPRAILTKALTPCEARSGQLVCGLRGAVVLIERQATFGSEM